MRFEWDQRKAAANLRKHGVSFDEAKTVFKDFDLRLIRDVAHSNGEDRFLAIGFSQYGRLLLYVIAIEVMKPYVLFLLAKQTRRKRNFINEVTYV